MAVPLKITPIQDSVVVQKPVSLKINEERDGKKYRIQEEEVFPPPISTELYRNILSLFAMVRKLHRHIKTIPVKPGFNGFFFTPILPGPF